MIQYTADEPLAATYHFLYFWSILGPFFFTSIHWDFSAFTYMQLSEGPATAFQLDLRSELWLGHCKTLILLFFSHSHVDLLMCFRSLYSYMTPIWPGSNLSIEHWFRGLVICLDAVLWNSVSHPFMFFLDRRGFLFEDWQLFWRLSCLWHEIIIFWDYKQKPHGGARRKNRVRGLYLLGVSKRYLYLNETGGLAEQ